LAGQTGFFGRLGRLIKEKAQSDVEKVFSGFSKTRDNLAVIDELLLYWNLADTDKVLDELEEVSLVPSFHRMLRLFPHRTVTRKTISQKSIIRKTGFRMFDYWSYEWVLFAKFQALLVSDFGPKITIKIVESLREDILAGKLKSGNEIKVLILSFCIYDINLLLS